MNDEMIKDLFFSVVVFTIEHGLEVRLENSTDKSTSNTFRGAFSDSVTDRAGLSLYVYQKDNGLEADTQDDEEYDDEWDAKDSCLDKNGEEGE